MKFARLSGTVTFALFSAALAAFAQQPSDEPNPAFDILSRDTADWYSPKNQLTFGFRILNNGPKVKFGNLGNVPSIRSLAPLSDGAVQRVYDNGVIAKDAPRTDEVDADGNQTSTPGGRYQTKVYNGDGTKVTNPDGTVTDLGDGTYSVIKDFAAYTPGYTRIWYYMHDEQAGADNTVALSTYSTTSDGAVAEKELGPSAGVEFQLARQMGNLSRRVQWSLVAGLALNDINNKIGGTIAATLNTHTDYYQVNGGVPSAPYQGPTFADLIASNGQVYSGAYESTPLISSLPVNSTDTSVAGGASVQGNWQVKGAYFMMRVGPSIRAQLSERVGLSASVGVAGAFAGSRYSVVENLDLPDVAEPISSVQESNESKFLGGVYADVNLDLMLNERTGLFGGVSMQQFGDYDQSVGGRTANIELGNAIGLRGGVSIKF